MFNFTGTVEQLWAIAEQRWGKQQIALQHLELLFHTGTILCCVHS
jgi:hypothetical protein